MIWIDVFDDRTPDVSILQTSINLSLDVAYISPLGVNTVIIIICNTVIIINIIIIIITVIIIFKLKVELPQTWNVLLLLLFLYLPPDLLVISSFRTLCLK